MYSIYVQKLYICLFNMPDGISRYYYSVFIFYDSGEITYLYCTKFILSTISSLLQDSKHHLTYQKCTNTVQALITHSL